MTQTYDDFEKIPDTDLHIGKQVRLRWKNGHPDLYETIGRITAFDQFSTDELFLKGIAIEITLGPEFNYRKTWAEIDELFPVPSSTAA